MNNGPGLFFCITTFLTYSICQKRLNEFPWHFEGSVVWFTLGKIKVLHFYDLNFCLRYRCFTCVAKGESRSRSAVTPSVRLSVRLSVRPSVPKSCHHYWFNYHETWYVDGTSCVVMHIGRKFWFPHFCGSYAPWNLENTYKRPFHCNSSETTDPFIMKLGM